MSGLVPVEAGEHELEERLRAMERLGLVRRGSGPLPLEFLGSAPSG